MASSGHAGRRATVEDLKQGIAVRSEQPHSAISNGASVSSSSASAEDDDIKEAEQANKTARLTRYQTMTG